MSTTTSNLAFNSIEEKRLRPWKGEEEVRVSWINAIEIATGLHLNAERDKVDSSYNHVFIEFKAPGLFKGSKKSTKFIEATEQRLLPYIQKASKQTGIAQSDFIGIAIDGEHVCFTQVIDDQIHSQHLIPFSPVAVDMVIDAIRLDTRRELITKNLIDDFGHGSAIARDLMQCLSDGLATCINQPFNNKVKMLFEEWRTLYGQVADVSVVQADAISKEMAFTWNGNSEDSLSARLFVIHTYNSLLIKLIAGEIVASHGLTSKKQPAQQMAVIENNVNLVKLLDYDFEKSKIFEDAGIKGFIEEAIFSWYLDLVDLPKSPVELLPSLRRLLSVLSLYRTDRLIHTRDVLRDVYQQLVPSKLRQSLGEFYTPDWLVDFTVDQAKDQTWLGKRVLDPTCGSGAFLLALIKRKREEAKIQGWEAKQTLKHICDSVWGFDLNPLAVQTARVNFLMEIADLIVACKGDAIEIPVLLADAIYSPASNPKSDENIVQYKIGSQVAKLDIILPSELALNRERLDQVFAHMSEDVERNYEFSVVSQRMINSHLITENEIAEWGKPLEYTYNQVLELHRKQWNGIWFRIVRNFFWSATAGEFDCIVGNPPWVRWSKLPEAYRDRVKPTCEDYGIFSRTKRHGGNELDISAMITYTVSDKWLKNDGRLAFVITGTIFKNPSSAGFRTFKLQPKDPSSSYLQPLSIHDLKALKPFEDASNHTVVAIFNKSPQEGAYPVPYSIWKAKEGFSRAIPSTLTTDEVLSRLTIEDKEAFPVSEPGSPWAILTPGRFSTIKYLSSESTWTKGRKGITTDLNGVYFIPILSDNGTTVQIRSRPEAGKKDIGSIKTQWVEPDLLYPLIKGAGDFEACYLKTTAPDYDQEFLYTFVPNNSISNAAYESAEIELNSSRLRKTKLWFSGFKQLLLDRSTYRRQMKGAPFHAIYNVGDYTFKPWKVIWPEMSSSFYAAVAGSYIMPINGERVFVPDHKVYFAAFDEKEIAYYLCGLLNSPTVREWLESHNVSIQIADIFKHLTLPEYDKTDEKHSMLGKLVEHAHKVHDPLDRQEVIENIEKLSETILSQWSAKI